MGAAVAVSRKEHREAASMQTEILRLAHKMEQLLVRRRQVLRMTALEMTPVQPGRRRTEVVRVTLRKKNQRSYPVDRQNHPDTQRLKRLLSPIVR